MKRGFKRNPLAVGNEYSFGPMYPGAGFRVTSIQLPGRAGYDGGSSGVAVQWLYGDKRRQFYLVKSEDEFWSLPQFKNAIDAEEE
jgi:hypothetical protein